MHLLASWILFCLRIGIFHWQKMTKNEEQNFQNSFHHIYLPISSVLHTWLDEMFMLKLRPSSICAPDCLSLCVPKDINFPSLNKCSHQLINMFSLSHFLKSLFWYHSKYCPIFILFLFLKKQQKTKPNLLKSLTYNIVFYSFSHIISWVHSNQFIPPTPFELLLPKS